MSTQNSAARVGFKTGFGLFPKMLQNTNNYDPFNLAHIDSIWYISCKFFEIRREKNDLVWEILYNLF